MSDGKATPGRARFCNSVKGLRREAVPCVTLSRGPQQERSWAWDHAHLLWAQQLVAALPLQVTHQELARPSTWWHCSSCPAGVVLTPRVHKAAPRAGLEIQTDLQLKFQGVQLGGERIWILSPSEGAMALKKVQYTTFMSNQLIPLEHGIWH